MVNAFRRTHNILHPSLPKLRSTDDTAASHFSGV
jgi:hypothetical protein